MFLVKKLHIFLGNHNCNYVCRRSLNSYSSQNVLKKHKQQVGEHYTASLRLSNESHLYWKKNHIHKNPLYIRMYANFENDNEFDNPDIDEKTTHIY